MCTCSVGTGVVGVDHCTDQSCYDSYDDSCVERRFLRYFGNRVLFYEYQLSIFFIYEVSSFLGTFAVAQMVMQAVFFGSNFLELNTLAKIGFLLPFFAFAVHVCFF